MKKILFYFFVFVIVILLMMFGYSNSTVVPLNLLIYASEYRLSTIIPALLLSGFILGLLTAWYIHSKIALTHKMQKRKADKAAKKLANNQSQVESPPQADEKPTTLPASTA